MSSKRRKTRPGTAIPGRAVENGTASKTPHASTNDSTISAADRQFQISDMLLHGEQNTLPLRHLKSLTDMKGRTLRRQIEQERRAGALIISDNKSGYFLASDAAEAQRFARSMQHRAREILRTARAIEEAAGLD